jgi:hypothetical protein
MNASVFDPKVFGAMTFTDSNSTESVPIPVGDWPFEITKSEVTSWSARDGSSSGLKLALLLTTSDEKVTEVTGRAKNSVKHEIMLDLTPEQGLDFGKGMNVQLGRARAACGLNEKGKPFSFDMFLGRNVIGSVSHRALDDGRLVADVKAIAAAGGPGSAAVGGYQPPRA